MRTLRNAVLFCLPLILTLSAAEPPLEIDSALRARVDEFYQLQTDRKFRQAEQFVAADTKDFYYESRKPDIRTVKIVGIQYADDFQSAKVMLSSHMQIMVPGATPKIMDVPFTSYWKIDGNQWCWYVDQVKLLDTPFGPVKSKGNGASEDLTKIESRISVAGMMDGVHADPPLIQLDPEHPKPATVTLKNTLPGPVTVQSLSNLSFLKVEIAKPNLSAEESTQVTITITAGSVERPKQITFRAQPMGQLIPVTIEYPAAK